MTQFIDSFFDNNTPGFKLWTKKVSDIKIDDTNVIFKGSMLKMNSKLNKLKERFFVLTTTHLCYFKCHKSEKIRGAMETSWVRVEYTHEEYQGRKRYCIRLIHNAKYCDFWVDDTLLFKEWKKHMSRVFIQNDFHLKYNAIKMIGKGSFARVYLVEDKETKERFAVKAFSKEYLLSQVKGKESIINEIKIMQMVKNPHIMNLEEVHESKNSIYMVLELLEGGELFNHIASKETLSLEDIRQTMRCLLDAIAYLADKNILHRDLKPENMILKEKGKLENCTLKLVDFGLATLADVPEYLFKRCGTPGYVAPEIINAPTGLNVHYNPKCDVFSAGVIFYILLTGKSPFNGKSFQEILTQNKVCRIDFKNPKIHKYPKVAELLQNMLDPNPVTRISARGALGHEFFKVAEPVKKEESVGECGFSNHLKEYLTTSKPVTKPIDNNSSFVAKEGGTINGETATIHDSNSNAGILSFKNVNSQRKPESGIKRESIFKYVLMKESHINEQQTNRAP